MNLHRQVFSCMSTLLPQNILSLTTVIGCQFNEQFHLAGNKRSVSSFEKNHVFLNYLFLLVLGEFYWGKSFNFVKLHGLQGWSMKISRKLDENTSKTVKLNFETWLIHFSSRLANSWLVRKPSCLIDHANASRKSKEKPGQVGMPFLFVWLFKHFLLLLRRTLINANMERVELCKQLCPVYSVRR